VFVKVYVVLMINFAGVSKNIGLISKCSVFCFSAYGDFGKRYFFVFNTVFSLLQNRWRVFRLYDGTILLSATFFWK